MSEQKSQLLTFLEFNRDTYRDAFIADLADLVNRDCGTDDKPGVDRVARWFERRCAEWSYAVQTLPQTQFGDNVVGRITGTGKARIMLIGHLDTVYPIGTAAQRPMHIVGDKIIGPGTCDIKGGLLVGLYAVRALKQIGFADFAELVFFSTARKKSVRRSRSTCMPPSPKTWMPCWCWKPPAPTAIL